MKALLEHLIREGVTDNETLETQLRLARLRQCSIFQILKESQRINDAEQAQILSTHHQMPIVDLNQYQLQENPIIPMEICRQQRLLPHQLKDKQLHVFMSDPSNPYAKKLIKQFHSGAIRIQLVNDHQLEEKFQHLLIQQLSEGKLNGEKSNKVNTEQLLGELLKQAINANASDIHLEAMKNHYRVRYRIDGCLQTMCQLPHPLAQTLLIKIKSMANLNIAESRIPQDGHFKQLLEAHYDIRVATCPTIKGEKLVLRILNQQQLELQLENLGLLDEQLHLLKKCLNKSHGLILCTGATGSGKTSTLYSALSYLNDQHKNIATIEDPVEIELDEINQTAINHKIKLDFARSLKALLRQDPDIIMIGEIRDPETAKIAIHAAMTGHLVLASLHTNSAFSALNRLQHFGIALQDIKEATNLIISQRLARKLCPHCRGTHCHHCYQGYKGRIGLFELLNVDAFFPINSSHKKHEPPENSRKNLSMKDCAQHYFSKGIIKDVFVSMEK